MEDYLKEIEFAVTAIIQAIWYEHDELEILQKTHTQLILKVIEQDKGTQVSGKNMFIPKDIEAMDQASNKSKELKHRIATRQFAMASLSGALLQLAKQGISITHGRFENCPDGPFIGSQTLKGVIWNARNQSLHWEERNFNPNVKNCFRKLSREFSPTNFGMFNTSNSAYSVIKLLGWRTFDDFKSTMLYLC